MLATGSYELSVRMELDEVGQEDGQFAERTPGMVSIMESTERGRWQFTATTFSLISWTTPINSVGNGCSNGDMGAKTLAFYCSDGVL